MIPLRDDVPRRHLPVITWILIGANVAAFLYELSLSAPELQHLLYLSGLVPRRFADPEWAAALHYPAPDLWPFLTCSFLHGGWLHLLGNVWMLWIFGDNVEDRLGPVRFLVFYTLCALLAGAVQFAANPMAEQPMIGASGAVAGVMGAYLVLYPRARVLMLVPIFFWPFFFEVPALLFLMFWFVLQFYSGALALSGAAGAEGVAWWAHVGGFLGGILLLAVLDRRPPRASRTVWVRR